MKFKLFFTLCFLNVATNNTIQSMHRGRHYPAPSHLITHIPLPQALSIMLDNQDISVEQIPPFTEYSQFDQYGNNVLSLLVRHAYALPKEQAQRVCAYILFNVRSITPEDKKTIDLALKINIFNEGFLTIAIYRKYHVIARAGLALVEATETLRKFAESLNYIFTCNHERGSLLWWTVFPPQIPRKFMLTKEDILDEQLDHAKLIVDIYELFFRVVPGHQDLKKSIIIEAYKRSLERIKASQEFQETASVSPTPLQPRALQTAQTSSAHTIESAICFWCQKQTDCIIVPCTSPNCQCHSTYFCCLACAQLYGNSNSI